MKGKKAIEMQVNFIVMLVLSMIVFGIGLTIVFGIFAQGEKVKEDLDQSTRDKIMDTLMSSSQPVVIPFNTETFNKGGKKVIGIGVRNDISGIENFFVEVKCDEAYTTDDSPICGGSGETAGCEDACGKWVTVDNPITIQKNDREAVNLFFVVPKNAKAGRYIFNVQVYSCDDEDCLNKERYGTIKKIYASVK